MIGLAGKNVCLQLNKRYFYNVEQDAQQCCWMIGLVGKGKGVGVVFLARESSSHVTLVPITNNSTSLLFQFLDSDVLFNVFFQKKQRCSIFKFSNLDVVFNPFFIMLSC